MKFLSAVLISTGLICVPMPAQQTEPPPQKESIVVTGTATPVPLSEADRDVSALDVPAKERALYNSWFDLLQLNPSLNLQQRAPGGFLGDLSIRGATFGQTLVLLNGMRLADVQTGHFNLDLPVPLEMVSTMEVLKGSGSALYGSDAIGGVVNIITKPGENNELRLLGGLGNSGFNQQHISGSFGGLRWHEQVAVARDFSSGFQPNRDYRNFALSSLSLLKSRLGASSVLLAYSDRPYGAEQFYGPYPSWERIKTWFVSAHQNLGDKTQASFAYRRHTDLFVLFRYNPPVYTNRHLEDSWQGDLRRHDNLSRNGVLSYGVEGVAGSINSTNLGLHSRTRGSAYAFYDLRATRKFTLSAGLREEVYGSREVATSPSLSGSFWVAERLKLRASASRAFRLPSFTDLYYSDPGNKGNPNLRPESATSYEGGADAYLKSNIHAAVTVFHRRDTNVIDYVKAPGSTVFTATNFNQLHFTGVEASLIYEPRAGQHLAAVFSGLHGVNASDQVVQSKYTFNYPVQSGVAEWRGSLGSGVIVRTRLGVISRLGRDPYGVWDASATYSRGRVRPFLQLTNITSSVYQDIPAIAAPKRGVIGGVELYLFGSR